MAQSTTSSTTHNIVKYSWTKVPLTTQVKTSEIQWKQEQSDSLRLTLSVTKSRTSTQSSVSGPGGQPLARHHLKVSYISDESEEPPNASQNANREVVFENLDLTSFSEIKYSGKELPLKAAHKSRSVAFRYLHPMIQDSALPQTYRRFQVTFNTEEDALAFVDSIRFICPCTVAREQRAPESQVARPAAVSRPPAPPGGVERRATEVPPRRTEVPAASRLGTISRDTGLPLPRSATTYRKTTMFADALSSSSLGEPAGSSQISGTPNAGAGACAEAMQETSSRPAVAASSGTATGTQARVAEEQGDRMNVDEPLAATQTGVSHRRSLASSVDPSPAQSGQAPRVPADQPGAVEPSAHVRAPREEQQPQPSPAGMSGSAERDSAEVAPAALLSAIRQGDSDLYNLSSAELQQLVAEVIREPGFPELLGRVHKMWKEKGLVEVQLATMRE